MKIILAKFKFGGLVMNRQFTKLVYRQNLLSYGIILFNVMLIVRHCLDGRSEALLVHYCTHSQLHLCVR